jgi:hypothetical protein
VTVSWCFELMLARIKDEKMAVRVVKTVRPDLPGQRHRRPARGSSGGVPTKTTGESARPSDDVFQAGDGGCQDNEDGPSAPGVLDGDEYLNERWITRE